MAKATGAVGGLFKKLGQAGVKAFEETKDNDPVAPGGGDLPAGIENGIAQLVDVRFGVYESGDNIGQYYFMAAGIVVEPKKLGKIPIEGLRTQIGPEPICATPKKTRKTIAEHMAWIQNNMKLLEPSIFAGIGLDQIEQAAVNLMELKPYFRFRTWKGDATTEYPNPQTFHSWQGAVEFDPDKGDTGVTDNTEEATTPKAATGKKTATAKAADKPKAAAKKGTKTEPAVDLSADLDATAALADENDGPAMNFLKKLALEAGISEEDVDNAENWIAVLESIRATEATEETEAEAEGEEATDYAALGEAADNGDQDAANKLTELGNEVGQDPNDHADKTWTDFAAMLVELEGEEAEAEAEGEAKEWAPVKGEVYTIVYAPGKKASDCEVLAVFPETQKVNVKCLADKKAYKGIAWDALPHE